MTDSIDTSEREAEEPAFINLPVREMSDEPAPQQPADALRTALQLALEATPEQLPAALDALRDQLGLTTSSPPCAMRYDFDGHGWRYIDAGSGSDWMTRVPGAEPVYDGPTRQVASINYTPGEWFDATSVDLMQQFFESRLPAIRETARRHGYAIGVHGSMRRDMDLIAAPWCDGASDPDTLAHAIADAACGITIASSYDWEQKPAGRVATSIPICWTHRPGVPGDGHIDLSVMPQAAPPAPQAAVVQQEPVGEVGSMPGTAGFTMACFRADEVPVGTKLYTHPAQQAKPQPDDHFPDAGGMIGAQDEPNTDLMSFYGVDSLAGLVKAQARHIEKLQSKLPQVGQPAFIRSREG